MKPQLQDLIDRYLDGAASDDEVRQLDEAVQQDATVRHAVFRAAHLEVSLRRLLTPCGEARPTPVPVPAARSGSWRMIVKYAAIALATAGGWIGTIFFAYQYHVLRAEHAGALQAIAALEARPPEAPRPMESARPLEPAQQIEPASPPGTARLVSADRVIETRGLVLALPEGDGKSIPVSIGGPIPAGRSLWTCPWGAAAIRLADGSSMQLDRNTTVAVSGADGKRRMAIKRGILFLTRQGATREEGIVVTSDHAAVEVIDAQVAVAVDDGRTLVEVAEGQVQVMPQPDGPSVVVPAGHYLIIGAATPPRVLAGRLAWRLEPAKPRAYGPTLP